MLKIVLVIVVVLQVISGFSSTVSASSQGVVVYQVMAGEKEGEAAATKEFVTIFNNSDQDVDVTGWCITSVSATLGCFNSAPGERLYVPARAAAKIASLPYAQAHPTPSGTIDHYDVAYSPARQDRGSIVGSGDEIRLMNGPEVVDLVKWDKTAPLDSGSVWQRIAVQPGILSDTDNHAADFVKISGAMPAPSSLHEIVTLPDLCPNLTGNEIQIPAGYMLDGAGQCVFDMCPNLPELQAIVPAAYEKIVTGECQLIKAPLQITELLPNAKGSDAGREYVELYNPTSAPVDLSVYVLKIGINADKIVAFPAGSMIAAGEYKAFYDSDMPFSLVNTKGKVTLDMIDGRTVSASEYYEDPTDDMAWALVDGIWQYTDRSSPGAVNLTSAPDEGGRGSVNTTLPSCAPGKYRHPLTNRCRNIDTDAAVIASCDADQYRNPETGRCRKIATAASVTPCKEGQYRSEETNRCRIIAAANSPTPCAEGQERNPATNRCRNILAKSVPEVAFALQPVQEGMKAFVGWWALGGLGVLATGYAGWEWRREIGSGLRRLSLKNIFRR